MYQVSTSSLSRGSFRLSRKGSFDEKRETVKLSMEDGYRLALKKLIEWINENIDSNKTRLFFAGLSVTHQR